MKNIVRSGLGLSQRVNAWLAYSTPLAMLLMRLWIAEAFFRSGLTKIADMPGTIALFKYVYHTPLLSPAVAAYTGTFAELVFPALLAFGLMGRYVSGFLFVYNIIAVASYPDIWSTGFPDHQAWGLMLLALTFYGPGRLSLDHLLTRLFPSGFKPADSTLAYADLNRWLGGGGAAFMATAALSAILLLKTLNGVLPGLDPAMLIGKATHTGVIGGWMIFLIAAIVIGGLAFAWLYPHLPGHSAVRGALFGFGAWLLAMLTVAPLGHAGLFAWRFGWVGVALLLVLSLVYGAILGAGYVTLTGTGKRSRSNPILSASKVAISR